MNECLSTNTVPCNGFGPLVNSENQSELTCKQNKECPSDGYCDKIHSKCCPKSKNLFRS